MAMICVLCSRMTDGVYPFCCLLCEASDGTQHGRSCHQHATPAVPDARRCALCPRSTDGGFRCCCRTCEATNGRDHGPLCQSKHARARQSAFGVSSPSTSPAIVLQGAACHRSGEAFPLVVADRFRRHAELCRGNRRNRPHMARIRRGEPQDRQAMLAAAWFWDRVRRRGAVHYRHGSHGHRHPDWVNRRGFGVDCSNFTAYLYNLVLGVRFTSASRAQGRLNYRRLKLGNLQDGDLMFWHRKGNRAQFCHAGIFARKDGVPGVLHSTGGHGGSGSGPQWSRIKGWLHLRFSHGFSLRDVAGY